MQSATTAAVHDQHLAARVRMLSQCRLEQGVVLKHFSVTAGPANRDFRPKLRNWTGIEARSSP